jgi:hypothetical protein
MDIFNISIIFAQLLPSSPNFKRLCIQFVVCALNLEKRIKLNLNNFGILMNEPKCEMPHNDRPKYEPNLFLDYKSYNLNNSCTIIILEIKISLILMYIRILLIGFYSILIELERGQKVKGDKAESIYYNNGSDDATHVFTIVKLNIIVQHDVHCSKPGAVFADPMIKLTQRFYGVTIRTGHYSIIRWSLSSICSQVFCQIHIANQVF